MIDEIQRLQRLAPLLEKRQCMNVAVRDFFISRGFLEVETPVRLPCPAMEDYIDAESSGTWYLRTSPELHMKRLLGAGYTHIFQIGPCFRHGEKGRLHNPEFLMLEWYRLQADYRDLLVDCRELLLQVARQVNGDTVCKTAHGTLNLAAAWAEITVAEAFLKYAKMPVDAAVAMNKFEEILVEQIEPRLGFERPTVLLDYPDACGGLARQCQGQSDRLERWELYLAGIEIANACSELIDAAEQQKRFAKAAEIRRREGRDVYPIDQHFMAVLRHGMLPAAGIALGLERLLMLLTGSESISQVRAFPEP